MRFAFHTSAPPVAPITASAATTSAITFHTIPDFAGGATAGALDAVGMDGLLPLSIFANGHAVTL